MSMNREPVPLSSNTEKVNNKCLKMMVHLVNTL